MNKLVTMFGTGDTYLVCALFRAYVAKYGPSEIICKTSHATIPRMFGIQFQLNDSIVTLAETGHWQTIEDLTYVHPSCPLNYTRPDQFTFKCGDISQADMYRALLDLPLNTMLDHPKINRTAGQIKKSALLIFEAKSWPNTQPLFWRKLNNALVKEGWSVEWNTGAQSLDELFEQCARTEWVIGPQCGVMSILTTARFACRKSFCTPAIDDAEKRPPDYPIHRTFPYAYVSKFSGEDFDVDEFKITDHNHDDVIVKLLQAQAGRLQAPVMTINAPLSPGDFLDRLAVLHVKLEKFDVMRRAAIQREHDRYYEIYKAQPFCGQLFDSLLLNHRKTFDLCSSYVPDALVGKNDEQRHAKAIQLNKERVELKRKIDLICQSPYSDVKDYYR